MTAVHVAMVAVMAGPVGFLAAALLARRPAPADSVVRQRWSLDSWRRASDPVVYTTALIFLGLVVTTIWTGMWQWAATGAVAVLVLGWVVALTEERRDAEVNR